MGEEEERHVRLEERKRQRSLINDLRASSPGLRGTATTTPNALLENDVDMRKRRRRGAFAVHTPSECVHRPAGTAAGTAARAPRHSLPVGARFWPQFPARPDCRCGLFVPQKCFVRDGGEVYYESGARSPRANASRVVSREAIQM